MALTIDYTGKTAVVIGGTSGINLGIAEMFARHGAAVAVASRSPE
jgi:NAD(P)-dependent dehydrogenase (short-subunit alcohol dehydrogenase family)